MQGAKVKWITFVGRPYLSMTSVSSTHFWKLSSDEALTRDGKSGKGATYSRGRRREGGVKFSDEAMKGLAVEA